MGQVMPGMMPGYGLAEPQM